MSLQMVPAVMIVGDTVGRSKVDEQLPFKQSLITPLKRSLLVRQVSALRI